jgi:hypothetical protein
MRDSLALALVRAERCRAAATRWAATTDFDDGDIVAGSTLLIALIMRARRRLRRKIARCGGARQSAT